MFYLILSALIGILHWHNPALFATLSATQFLLLIAASSLIAYLLECALLISRLRLPSNQAAQPLALEYTHLVASPHFAPMQQDLAQLGYQYLGAARAAMGSTSTDYAVWFQPQQRVEAVILIIGDNRPVCFLNQYFDHGCRSVATALSPDPFPLSLRDLYQFFDFPRVAQLHRYLLAAPETRTPSAAYQPQNWHDAHAHSIADEAREAAYFQQQGWIQPLAEQNPPHDWRSPQPARSYPITAAGKWRLFCAAVFPFNLFAAARARQKAQTLRQRCP